MRGRIIAFDEPRGIGEVQADDGVTYRFHCTQIADGSRSIPVGAVVTFETFEHPVGGTEATAIASVERPTSRRHRRHRHRHPRIRRRR